MEFECVRFYQQKEYQRPAVYAMAFSLRKKKRNKEKFLAYFKKKSSSKDETNGIQITNVLTSVTENVTSEELAYAEEEMQKTYKCPKKYQVEIPTQIKKEVGLCARDFSTASAIKKYTTEYPKYSFIRTTVSTWKKKCNDIHSNFWIS